MRYTFLLPVICGEPLFLPCVARFNRRTVRTDSRAAAALLSYTLWSTFAAVMNAEIARRNCSFPISSTGRALEQIAKAKATCAGCPVRQACLGFALEHDLMHGISGGTTPEDRQTWRHERRSDRLRAGTLRSAS
jgi:WhiB family redox-sensing transcriptional regulator